MDVSVAFADPIDIEITFEGPAAVSDGGPVIVSVAQPAVSVSVGVVQDVVLPDAAYLSRAGRLAEFDSEDARAVARANLGLAVIDGGIFTSGV